MCMAGDVATRDGRHEVEEEDEEYTALAQEETTMAQPPWPPADMEGSEAVGAEDFHIEYLQISDEPSAQTAMEEQEEATSGNPHLVNDGEASANNGHAGSLAGAVVSSGRNPLERIVTVNGMQFHVYGNVSGLELLESNPVCDEDVDIPDSDEEEEERHRAAMERALAEATEADAARRAAPIPPEHRVRIVNAMKGINLGGFRPSWADFVPEDQWISKIKENATSSST